MLCEDVNNSATNLTEGESMSAKVPQRQVSAEINVGFNETISDASAYTINRTSVNETESVSITSVKKFSCLFDQADDETSPGSEFQVNFLLNTDF